MGLRLALAAAHACPPSVRESGVMTDMLSDGGTDIRSGSGRDALERYAPDAASTFGLVVVGPPVRGP